MKFWEALREMERGAVCGSMGTLYRLINGWLEFFEESSNKWVRRQFQTPYMFANWSIHKPAPNDAEITWQQAFEMMVRGETVQAIHPTMNPFLCRMANGKLETDRVWSSWQPEDYNLVFLISSCAWRKKPEKPAETCRETFDFAEAWKRRNDKWITRPERTGLRLSREVEMLGFWKDERGDDGNRLTQLVAFLATNDLDATDWHEAANGSEVES